MVDIADEKGPLVLCSYPCVGSMPRETIRFASTIRRNINGKPGSAKGRAGCFHGSWQAAVTIGKAHKVKALLRFR